MSEIIDNNVQNPENANGGVQPEEKTGKAGALNGADLTALTSAVMAAIDSRTQRAEKSVVRSMAEQYGMQETELTAILDKAKAEKAAAMPEAAQHAIDEANRRADEAAEKAKRYMINAEAQRIGAEMGVVDVAVAMQLTGTEGITVDENGKVTGLTEAFEKLKEQKPYLTTILNTVGGALLIYFVGFSKASEI